MYGTGTFRQYNLPHALRYARWRAPVLLRPALRAQHLIGFRSMRLAAPLSLVTVLLLMTGPVAKAQSCHSLYEIAVTQFSRRATSRCQHAPFHLFRERRHTRI